MKSDINSGIPGFIFFACQFSYLSIGQCILDFYMLIFYNVLG